MTPPSGAGPTDFWRDKRVVVTGRGFLGSYVLELLKERGCPNPFVPRSREYDLRREADIVGYSKSRGRMSFFISPRWSGESARTGRIRAASSTRT